MRWQSSRGVSNLRRAPRRVVAGVASGLVEATRQGGARRRRSGKTCGGRAAAVARTCGSWLAGHAAREQERRERGVRVGAAPSIEYAMARRLGGVVTCSLSAAWRCVGAAPRDAQGLCDGGAPDGWRRRVREGSSLRKVSVAVVAVMVVAAAVMVSEGGRAMMEAVEEVTEAEGSGVALNFRLTTCGRLQAPP